MGEAAFAVVVIPLIVYSIVLQLLPPVSVQVIEIVAIELLRQFVQLEEIEVVGGSRSVFQEARTKEGKSAKGKV